MIFPPRTLRSANRRKTVVPLTATVVFCATEWLALLGFVLWAGLAQANSFLISHELSAYLEQEALPRDLAHAPELRHFYRQNGYQPIWVIHNQLTPSGEKVLTLLIQAERQGLDPEDYQARQLRQQAEWLNSHSLTETEALTRQLELELSISDRLLTFARHLSVGRMRPLWEIPAKTVDLNRLLPSLASANDPIATLLAQAPRHSGYQALQAKLERYLAWRQQGGWPMVDYRGKLVSGDSGAGVRQLRARLGLDTLKETFDLELKKKVIAFQKRHHLSPDGIVGKNTLAALNVPIERRIAQIKANLERWRWLPDPLEPRHVWVNLPGFYLDYIEPGQPPLTMPVIVGRQKRATPLFFGTMTYLVFNPSWYVPRSIAVKDKLPKLIRDPGYIDRHNMVVYAGQGRDKQIINPYAVPWHLFNQNSFPFRLVQKPGPGNALGKVKFMFPNRHNVYLHDTSEPYLFKKTLRSFSSGCIRVAQPKALAEAILDRQPEQIAALFEQTDKKTIRLKQPVPVYLVYFTAWVDHQGQLQFGPDIYQRDPDLIERLQTRSPSPALRTAQPKTAHASAS